MKTRLVIASSGAVGALLMVGLAPASAQAACSHIHLSIRGAHHHKLLLERAVTCLVNQERARYGLPRYAFDAKLQHAAQVHNDDMVKQQYFEHDGKDGRSFSDRVTAAGYTWGATAENIAINTTPALVVDAWLKSPGHCRNILSPDYTQMGVGVTQGAASHDPHLHHNDTWTQVFARPIDASVPSTDQAPSGGCPRSLGPDQSGPGDDGTGAGTPAAAAAAGRPRVIQALVSARSFFSPGHHVTVNGSTAPDTAGQTLRFVARRGMARTVGMARTTADGRFHIVLRSPGGKGPVRLTISLPARAGINTAASTTQLVGVKTNNLPVR